jgi:Zn-dependent metalloprotease
MHTLRHPFCRFVPPHVLDELAKSADPNIRDVAIETIKVAVRARTTRQMIALMPRMAAIPSPTHTKDRLVYDMQQRSVPLPGELVRREGNGSIKDEAVNEAYDYAGVTYDFYQEVLGRNSLDGNGMSLISSVHYGRRINNAFFDGEQMLYGDGDGQIFISFTKALDVVAHELTHGVVQHTSNLVYQDQPGALNESFADVMSACVKQRFNKQTVAQADWLLGDVIMGPAVADRAKSLRTFKAEKAYVNVPEFGGDDPQPKHMRDFVQTADDNGGVHINSGIPNHAFNLVATQLGGNSWEKAGLVWYKTLLALTSTSDFQAAANMSYQIAVADYGMNSDVAKAVRDGWSGVGIEVRIAERFTTR